MAILDKPRAGLARAVQQRIAGNDFADAHAKIWYTPGERWFRESDAIWRVHADAAMFVGGIRALLLQSLHPVAMRAVSEHSGYQGDPWGRLHRTSTYLATTTYGAIPDAERSIKIVRAIHSRVRGQMPDGTPYRADDPHLLTWVHIAEIDSFLASHRVFGADRLSAEDCDTYVRQTGEVARRLGVPDPPQSTLELAERLAAYRPEMRWSGPAAEAAELLLRNPPLPGPAKAGYAVLAAGAISVLPAWVRAELRLPTLPITDRVVAQPLTRTALRTLRWALGPQAAA